MRKYRCWAIKTKRGYAQWGYTDYVVDTCLFPTKASAELYRLDQQIEGKPVKVKVTVELDAWQAMV